ncbi:MAG: TrkA family potassium uptake protein [Bacillales bacterium]|nr:TrkA family potassium uptake protein [Bacillales bacterium]
MFFTKWKARPILVMGCGWFGSRVAGDLSLKGYSVFVIDKDQTAFRKLPDHFSGYEIIGDATDIRILERAEIQSAQMVVAATDHDSINCLISQMASRIYHIPKVYVRFHDPENQKLIYGYQIEAIYPSELTLQEFNRIAFLSEVKE